eukprot:TRINITY_DN18753_c0_g1_i1.p1 TRINITY_DN18753_c0_g1~~TRINITY_DN18753_c0_g1_i1.p1  ORF type:complete len:225 (-),score=48.30 TRINITY_DN18753_c0_g1_i1:503-1177(-)
MSSSQHHDYVECEVSTLGGSQFVVQAESSWKVWELKEEIAAVTNIPIFEQHLIKDLCVMRNVDALINATDSNHAPHLNIGLSRWSVTDTLCDDLLSLAWRGFRAFSKDCGDTIEGARVVSMMRYAGLHEGATLVRREYELPESLSFVDLVALLAELKEALTSSSNLEGIREFDLEDDSDDDSEDSSDDDDDDDERCVHDRLRELNDPDLMCDARLFLKSRRNTS